MKFIDPHIHCVSRTTDDYQYMARCGVVAVPNVVFYDRQEAGRSQVRFAFCKRDEVLADAAARLRTLSGHGRDRRPPGH